jgi:hypothetical protein
VIKVIEEEEKKTEWALPLGNENMKRRSIISLADGSSRRNGRRSRNRGTKGFILFFNDDEFLLTTCLYL